MTPNLPRLGGPANWLSGFLVVQAFWLMFRSHQNRWRRERLRLAPLSLRAPLSSLARRGVPVLYGFSPSVIPVPRDWHGAGTAYGYWFLDSPAAWTPPPELVNFLDRGPPPLYIGFGSMASHDPGRTAGIVIEALRRTGLRAILASGWGGLRGSHLPPTAISMDFVPHDWLFRRVCGAVHHGGAGTTAAALRAGVPSVIVPFFADQFFWGSRLSALGLSPSPIPQGALSATSLEKALRVMTGSGEMRARCRVLGQTVEAERGVELAAAAADRYLRSVIRLRTH
jgi:UDP:flavonoid glycosyltransferase YjiC (YdhE family)